MDVSADVCSPVCVQKTKELEERIMSLEIQVNKFARNLIGFEEIIDEILIGVRGHLMHAAEEKRNVQLKGDNAVHAVNENSSQVLSNDPNYQFDDSTIWENADTTSRASTPDLIIDEGPFVSTSSASNSESLPNSRTFDGTDDLDQTQNNTANMNWLILDQQNTSAMDVRDMAVPSQLGTRAGPETKRFEMAFAGSSASQSMILLPDPSLVCPHCSKGFVFKNKNTLNQHIQVHQGIRYMCGAVGCVSTFTRMAALRDHQAKMAHVNGSIKVRIVN